VVSEEGLHHEHLTLSAPELCAVWSWCWCVASQWN